MADGAQVRVAEGDTLWSIARRCDVDVEALKEANGIGKDNWLVAGSELRLPNGGGRAETRNEEADTKPKLRPGDLRVRVREGDTLWDISRRVDVPVDDLVRACGGNTVIQPGQDILVPRQLRLRPVSGKVNRPKPPEEGHEPFFHEFHITKTIEEMREEPHMQKFMRALQTVETSNMWPPPRGDDGTSIGPLQISQLYHADAWELDRTTRKKGYFECELDLAHSEHTCLKYWMRWCPWALKFGDLETLARVHNGGPSYHLAPKTRKYWKKVKGELKSYDFKLNPRLRDWHAAKVRQETLGHSYVPLEARTLFAVDMTGLLTTALPPLRRLTGGPDA